MAGKRLGKEDERHLWPQMCRAIREIQPRWVVGENVLGLVNWSGGLVFHEVQSDLEAAGYEVQPFVLPACAVNAPHRRDRVWFVAYANGCGSNRTEKYENSKSHCRNGQQSNNINNDGEIWWATANTNSDGQHGSNGKYEKHTSQGGKYALGEAEPIHNKQPIVEHSNGFGQERRLHTNKSQTTIGEQFSKRNARSFESTDWQNFPTQSPICSGDDGLPTELDGITFSKWRNESIKGYGNAIVPQVVYQIFKAIEEYEKTLSLQ